MSVFVCLSCSAFIPFKYIYSTRPYFIECFCVFVLNIIRHPSVFTAWPTHGQLIFLLTVMLGNHCAHLTQDMIHTHNPLQNDSLRHKHWSVGFYGDFPSVLIMNTFALILDWGRVDRIWMGLCQCLPPPFNSYFVFNIFKKYVKTSLSLVSLIH